MWLRYIEHLHLSFENTNESNMIIDQGEHYQRNILRVFVIVSDPVGNPESSSFHIRSPKSMNQSPNCLCMSTRIWFLYLLFI